MNTSKTKMGDAIAAWCKAHPHTEFTNEQVHAALVANGINREGGGTLQSSDVASWLSRRTLNYERGVTDSYSDMVGIQATGKRSTWIFKPGEASISARTRSAQKQPKAPKAAKEGLQTPCVDDICEIVGTTKDGKLVLRHEDNSIGIYKRVG